ncbi:MAG: OadG family protein [Methylococcales bacterium]|nr:OadG family protein [Methylococcales bacterium]
MTTQLTAGLELLMVGMGIVFLFLALLVILSVLMSKLVLRYLPVDADVAPARGIVGIDHKVTAAITSAVHQYRIKHKQKD